MPDFPPPPRGTPHGDATARPPTGASERLNAALRATPLRYEASYAAARRDLKGAVCAAVEELRAQGLGPEKVLVIIKSHVARYSAHPTDVLDDVVRWCIAQYYAAGAPCDVPPGEQALGDD